MANSDADADTQWLHGLAPVVGVQPKVLVLGSMPSHDSLRHGQYYAHPHNAFWAIMGNLFGAGKHLDYNERYAILKQRHIALWDVVQQCQRRGSMDTAIISSSIVVNNIPALLQHHPSIRQVFFNGAKAEQIFISRLASKVAHQRIAWQRLPSTSPAHAALPLARKLEMWRCVARTAANPADDRLIAKRNA